LRKRLGIIQSNYIPWKGYFDFIDSVDEFVLLDDVQYTRRDWRNRNLIKTADGARWLTISVDVKGKFTQRIDETRIADKAWSQSHLSALQHAYGRAPFFRDEWDWICELYQSVQSEDLLSQVNHRVISEICKRLDIRTPIRRSTEFSLMDGKNERLLAIAKQTGATEYLSGPAAGAYLDAAQWRAEGVEIFFKSYEGYPEYRQLHGSFEHGVTILDLIFNTGPNCRHYLKSARDVERSA
jgi:hypothetical protein